MYQSDEKRPRSLLHFVQFDKKNRPSRRFLPCKLRKDAPLSGFFAASSAKKPQVQQAPRSLHCRSPNYGLCRRIPLIAIIITLTACSQIPGRLRVIEGNFLNARGQYPGAISAYLGALNSAEAVPYAGYGLGVIYLAMDEAEAALDQFAAAAPPSGHAELVYRLHYNTGVIRFRQGDFAAAAGDFRRALEADGSRIEAKRNLELSLLSLTRQGREQASVTEGDGAPEGSDALFDYMHEKEADRWKSREWTEDADVSGPDY
ncbi:hypothetical protein FACS1894130_05890 [Spirochaetia bacterium]|nr:hypothetical protein FACS1894130_05890 [Spirochaetia bacterium]